MFYLELFKFPFVIMNFFGGNRHSCQLALQDIRLSSKFILNFSPSLERVAQRLSLSWSQLLKLNLGLSHNFTYLVLFHPALFNPFPTLQRMIFFNVYLMMLLSLFNTLQLPSTNFNIKSNSLSGFKSQYNKVHLPSSIPSYLSLSPSTYPIMPLQFGLTGFVLSIFFTFALAMPSLNLWMFPLH